MGARPDPLICQDSTGPLTWIVPMEDRPNNTNPLARNLRTNTVVILEDPLMEVRMDHPICPDSTIWYRSMIPTVDPARHCRRGAPPPANPQCPTIPEEPTKGCSAVLDPLTVEPMDLPCCPNGTKPCRSIIRGARRIHRLP